jgi:hypothetical protein
MKKYEEHEPHLKNHLDFIDGVKVMVFNTTLRIFELYRGGQFYWWEKLEKD